MREEQARRFPRRRSAAEAERLVAEFEASGLSRREFCRARGLSIWTLDGYRKRLQKARRAREGADQFVAVEVSPPKPPAEGAAGSGVLLVLASGRRIEVRRGFDSATLEDLVRVLERS